MWCALYYPCRLFSPYSHAYFCLTAQYLSGAFLCARSRFPHHLLIMPPPKKRVMRLRAACLKRWSAPASQNASPVAPSGEFLPADSSDDDVYVYESDTEVADDAVDTAKTIVLKWKKAQNRSVQLFIKKIVEPQSGEGVRSEPNVSLLLPIVVE